jgi:hypothetical protein
MPEVLGKERKFDEATLEQSLRLDRLIEEVMADYLGSRRNPQKEKPNGIQTKGGPGAYSGSQAAANAGNTEPGGAGAAPASETRPAPATAGY